MPRVLISSYPIRNQPGPFRDLLVEAGFTPVDVGGDNVLTGDQLRELLPTVEAILACSEVLSAGLFDRAPALRVIARTGVGYDAVDVEAATARGIVVVITPGTNQESVAEQAFGLLLALTRNVVNNDRTIQAGGWDRSMVRPLRGSTLGLVGLGRIGRAMVGPAVAFGMRVLAFDPVEAAQLDEARGLVERVDLADLFRQADVVSLHCPLVAATRGLIDRRTLALMKPGALLINTARGGLVVEADLAEALAAGHLAGAGLDVLEREPPEPGNPLLGLPNVVISPHVGGLDTRSMEAMATLAARCVVDLHRGLWPSACVVNRELEGRWRW